MSLALQWGRDQLIAETGLGGAGIAATGELQWDRDQLIAETGGYTGTTDDHSHSFNGAAIN